MPHHYDSDAFSHTRLSFYLTFTLSAVVIACDSAQTVLSKLHGGGSRRWWVLYGVLVTAAHVYLKPFIRQRLGSAEQSSFNGYAVYITWLLASLVYHVPSLQDLGINVKADLSVFFLCFVTTITTVAALHVIGFVVAWILDSTASVRQFPCTPEQYRLHLSTMCYNALTLTICCCTYFGVCGDVTKAVTPDPSSVKYQICHKWLHPLDADVYSQMSRFMLWVGESSDFVSQYQVDNPLDGKPQVGITHIISPVTSLWLTLMLMYVIHSFLIYLPSEGDPLSSRSPASVARAHSTSGPSQRSEVAEFCRARTDWLTQVPDFMPMVAWFSGTSADIVTTGIQLGISLKLFQGRFDMRAMQAATAASMADKFNESPMEGDGYTYEQFADRDELWFDFCADTGDGGNSTYTVASALAAPSLLVRNSCCAGSSPHDSVSRKHAEPRPTAPSTAPSYRASPIAAAAATVAQAGGKRQGGEAVCAEPRPAAPATAPSQRASPQAAAATAASQAVGERHRQNREVPGGAQAAASPDGKAQAADNRPAEFWQLPRGDLMLIGGDLAYPLPTAENFEKRLFGPFQDALPPPRHYHPDRVVVHKPDLPPEYGVQDHNGELKGFSPRSSRHTAQRALRSYAGPQCFAIPGNHDWIDGLNTYMRHILHRGWLGGWLLPQEKSYFAIALPHGWWLFGFDLALETDVDMFQYRYFANVVEHRLLATDRVVLMTHEPVWLQDWFSNSRCAPNLRLLIRGHLRGRARAHICGDLHFYMRHSFQRTPPPPADPASPPETSAAATPSPSSSLHCDAAHSLHAQESPQSPCFGAAAAPDRRSAAPDQRSAAATPSQDAASNGNRRSAGVAPAQDAAINGNVVSFGAVKCAAVRSRGRSKEPGGTLARAHNVAWEESDAAASSAASSHLTACAREASSQSTPFADSVPPAARLPTDTSGYDASSGSECSSPTAWVPIPAAAAASVGAAQQRTPGHDASPLGLPQASALLQLSRHSSCSTSSLSSSSSAEEFGSPQADMPYMRFHHPLPPGASPTDNTHPSLAPLRTNSPFSTAPKPPHRASRPGSASAPPFDVLPGSASAPHFDKLPGSASAPPFDVLPGGSEASTHTSTHNTPSLSRCNSPAQSVYFDAPERGAAPPTPRMPALDMSQLRRANTALLTLQPHLYDPPHLICNGLGGAFLHPTHVFSYAKFSYVCDAAVDATANIYSHFDRLGPRWMMCCLATACMCAHHRNEGPVVRCAVFYSHFDRLGPRSSVAGKHQDGQYVCASVYPSPKQSLDLSSSNIWFRSHNSTFDYVGGLVYFLIVISLLPQCSSAENILNAPTLLAALVAMRDALAACISAVFLQSQVSLVAVICLFLAAYGFAACGGVGSYMDVPRRRRAAPPTPGIVHEMPLLKARKGGLLLRLAFAFTHFAMHVTAALVLVLIFEVGAEICIRHSELGSEGYHSLFNWFTAGQQRLLSPGSVDALRTYSLGLYPRLIQWAMAIFDLPEAIAVSRNTLCREGGSLSRIQMGSYLLAVLAYYWLLATPVMSFIFGFYLYVSVSWYHVHPDEAYSSIKTENYKGFLKLHIDKAGALEIFSLATDTISTEWAADPRWIAPSGGGCALNSAHDALHPSKWIPTAEAGVGSAQAGRRRYRPEWLSEDYRVIDYLKVD